MVNESIQNSKTLCRLFLNRVGESADRTAYEQEVDGVWKPHTWKDYGDSVRKVTLGLKALGVPTGSRIAVWGETMAEWTVIDLATMAQGGFTSGIYQTCTPEQAKYIIEDSGSTLIAVDNATRLQMALSIREQTPLVRAYITWECEDDPENDVYSLNTLMKMGEEYEQEHPDAYEESIEAVTSETTAVLIYTSGTTGPPKGVMLSHKNCLFCARSMYEQSELSEDSTVVSFLPLSHVAEHLVGFFSRIYAGSACYFLPDLNRFGDVVRAKSPNTMGAVPRLYEKAYTAIMERRQNSPTLRRKVFDWAVNVGREFVESHGLRREGVSLPLKYRIADKLVLSKVRLAFGGKVRYMVSGAAPIAPEIVSFFNAVGLPFLEVYGMTECSGVSHTNTLDHFKVGTVGRVLPGFECRIAEDGEIIVRGDGVFQGYLNKPEATAETLQDGWLHTGDIGEVDEEGFLRITDRKKNILVTAGGKNVAPANIEKLIKREPMVSQVIVIGDRRRFLAALITLSTEELDNMAGTPDFQHLDRQGLIESEFIQERVRKVVNEANAELARYENIRQYKILDREFMVEHDEMTPTLKLKRRVIEDVHSATIETFYAE